MGAKVPDLGGIPAEVLVHGGKNLFAEIHHMISDVWSWVPVS